MEHLGGFADALTLERGEERNADVRFGGRALGQHRVRPNQHSSALAADPASGLALLSPVWVRGLSFGSVGVIMVAGLIPATRY